MPEKLLGASIFLNVVIKLNRGLQQKISSVLVFFLLSLSGHFEGFYFSCSKVTDAI